MNRKRLLTAAVLALTGAAAPADLLVDYSVPTVSSANFGTSADINTDNGDTFLFSDTDPLVSGATGGQNSTIYGGLITTWSVAKSYNIALLDNNLDRGLQIQVWPNNVSDVTAKGVVLWKKADFLNGSAETVAFTAGDELRLNINWSVVDSRETRFVVKQGGTWYVSAYVSTGTGTLSVDPTATQWAVLNTTDYTWGSFSAVTLDDIRGVGAYLNLSRLANSGVSWRIDDFQAVRNFGILPIELATIFADGCVLQRDQTVPIWGTANPDEVITVAVKSQSVQAVADSKGKWRAQLSPESAGGPYTLTVSSAINDPVALSDVYFGDVWMLTGQSNMFQTLLNQDDFYPQYYPVLFPNSSDDFDDVRFAIATNVESAAPLENIALTTPWNRWEASALSNMSTVGYFFIHALNEALDANGMDNVPLGVIKVCVGGTAIERWMSAEAIAGMGEAIIDPISPSGYYNGMIAPIEGYAVKGVLWYQGESNAGTFERVEQYPLLKQTLIGSWRAQWGIDFPFYFVQLAAYWAFDPIPGDSFKWAWMREAQTECLAIPNTAMACIIDTGFQDYIHPPYKDIVGQRLARIALADSYGLDVVTRGPTVSSVEITGSSVLITFDNVADGLRTQAVDAKPDAEEIAGGYLSVSVSANTLAGFAICGADQVFFWATEAQIVGTNQVRISNPVDVPQPVAVRYAWQDFPLCNLYNSEGLPAEPFRTDNFTYGTSTGAALSQPPLGIFPGQSTFLLEWPPLPAEWVLESSPDLTSTSWVELTGSAGDTNTQVPLPTPGQPVFFRLNNTAAP